MQRGMFWVVAVMLPGSVMAANSSATFVTSATIRASCSASAATLPFGAYSPGRGPARSTALVSLRCTRNTPFTVALDAGTGGGASFGRRLMTQGANTLEYNLYVDPAFTLIFGDGSSGTRLRADVGAGMSQPQSFAIYGRLPDSPGNRRAAPGRYRDTVTVTINY